MSFLNDAQKVLGGGLALPDCVQGLLKKRSISTEHTVQARLDFMKYPTLGRQVFQNMKYGEGLNIDYGFSYNLCDG